MFSYIGSLAELFIQLQYDRTNWLKPVRGLQSKDEIILHGYWTENQRNHASGQAEFLAQYFQKNRPLNSSES
jgi:hypothetical protein